MAKGNQFQARLDNQKAQLERHGYSAEVVVRTTPEATDMINFARLWEYIIVQADRQSRGFMSADKREAYDKTRKDYLDSVEVMLAKMKDAIERHNLDLSNTNFVSRIAQRYHLADKSKKVAEKKPAAKKETPVKAEVKAESEDQVEGL